MADNHMDEEILKDHTAPEEESAAQADEKAAASEEDAVTADSEDSQTNGEEAAAGEADGESNTDSDQTEEAKEEKKAKKLKKKKDKKDEQIEELQDMVKRQMAEFDNFRKRTEKEKAQMFEVGAKSIIEKILPVVDNFERGLAAIPEEEQGSSFADGMNMIYKQLINELEQAGVAPIEAVGQEFNPDFHNAVMQVENDELESGTVAQELQRGYTYRDTVVRHSMVAVVQ